MYKMEVLRDAESKTRPVFRVTTNSGEQVRFLDGRLVCIESLLWPCVTLILDILTVQRGYSICLLE